MLRVVYAILLLLVFSALSLSQEKTFIREYTHTVGDADSKITSRAIALNQVKKILLEEIGVYIESTFEMEKTETDKDLKELTKNQIVSITAGITETKILDEIWDGSKFYIKAEITLDIDNVKKKLGEIAKDRDKTKQLEEANNKANLAYAELSKIKEQLNATISEKEKLSLQLEYAKNTDVLSAYDWRQKGYNAQELGEWDDAILYFQKVIELDPDGITYDNIGKVYEEKGDWDKAWFYYHRGFADTYCLLGRLSSEKGEYDRAIEMLQAAIDSDSNYALAYDNMGMVYEKKGDYNKARLYQQKGLAVKYYDLGLSYANKENYEKAIEKYKKAVEIVPDYFDAYYNMGIAYKNKGNYDKAIECYKRAIEIDPKDGDAYNNMGIAYKNKENYDKEIECYQKAIDIDPNFAIAYYNMGLAYGNKGNYDKAIEGFQKTIDLDPNYANAYYNMGVTYQNKGNYDKAIECYQKAAQLGDKQAQEYLNYNGISW